MNAAKIPILMVVLLALAAMPGAAAPLAGPCVPGAAYDPACDVDHDSDVDIFDIQLTAGHWSQSGPWVSDNNHIHLGQTWTGTNNPLNVTGSYGAPDFAGLVLSNSNADGDGLHVVSAGGDGMYVSSAGYAGVQVWSAGRYGMAVGSAGEDGLFVANAGDAGVMVYAAEADGICVFTVGSPSQFYESDAKNGFEVAGAQGNGLFVGRADGDGAHIVAAGDDGIQLGDGSLYPAYGLYVPVPGTANSTLLPNTANASGQWALYTTDNIEAGNVLLGSQSLLAVVGGDDALTPGDVVAAAGLADPLPGSQPRLPQVRLATTELANVVGVVSGRMALRPAPGKEGVEILLSAEGPAQPGDYVAITVLGVAQVKVDGAAPVVAGQRLTVAATPGHVRALRSVEVEGVTLDERGPTVGVALEAARDELVWVLVNPQ